MAVGAFDAAILFDAIHFASLKDGGQPRREGEASPFLGHPLETARILAQVGGVADPSLLLASLLQDVFEDTGATPAEIERRYGRAVRRLVEEVTDGRRLPTAERRRRQLERAPHLSRHAKLITLADKIAHLGHLPQHWSWADRAAYVDFAARIGVALRGASGSLDALLMQTLDRARRQLRTPVPPVGATPRGMSPAPLSVRPEVARRLRKLQQIVSSAEELTGDLVDALGPDAETGPPSGAPPAARHPPKGRRRFPDPALATLAERGVAWVTIEMRTAREALIHVEGGEPFATGPVLAQLVSQLAAVAAPAEEGFEPFQSLAMVAARLGTAAGRKYAPRHITVYINRLRVLMQTRGKTNPMLIETCKKRGVRFRVRRRSS